MRTALLPMVFLAGLGLAAAQGGDERELELVYVANEGFLMRAGEDAVLIDAFINEPYSIYAAAPEELFAAMVDGEAPFEDVDLALTSHHHPDHFQAAAALAFVQARPEVPFLSSPQVLDALVAALGEDAHADRFEAFLPEAGETVVAREDVRVELLRLAHSGGARTASVQNLGHLIDVGGVRVLHVGDADAEARGFVEYELAGREVDVALVPYWWLGDTDSVAEARKLTGAEVLVAVHVPPGELDEVAARLATIDREVLLFREPGEKRVLTLPAR